MVMALNRVSEIAGLHLGEVDVAGVPKRRLIALAKEGRNETATKLDRLPYEKKIATLLATVRWLESSATDDAVTLSWKWRVCDSSFGGPGPHPTDRLLCHAGKSPRRRHQEPPFPTVKKPPD
ncbi:hypothetical protein [Arthrobacter sp. H14]|uniref:hypothetical protein n=1 Tax=Arthrobacter sp. H14 TaxID=1312959 RepID=UPI0004B00BE2|nr:hypothetical protein [Arthrobacter sp. H14]